MTSRDTRVPKRIVFVCVENSCRSQIAEAVARRHGGSRVAVYSAGSRPSGIVNTMAIAVLRDRGYDLTLQVSKSLADLPDIEYDAVVSMGCGEACPRVRAKQREEWKIPDPKNMPLEEFKAVCDLIEGQVKALLWKLVGPEEPSPRMTETTA